MFDIMIGNGKIIDGTGNKPYDGYIGIRDDKIAYIGSYRPNDNCKTFIDAYGLIIAPGFIDVHSHTDDWYLINPFAVSKVLQGVTTEIVGNCGESAAPYGRWETIENYMQALTQQGIGINVATLAGHGQIHNTAFSTAKLSVEERITKMKNILYTALNQGALGMSTGLVYAPGCFTDQNELYELCKIIKFFNGVYATHMRDEGNELEAAVIETIELCQRTKVRGIISHHKAKGMQNWGKTKHTISLLTNAKAQGVDIYCDVYPYKALNTSLKTLLPTWVLKNGIEGMIAVLENQIQLNHIFPVICKNAENDFNSIIINNVSTNNNKCFLGLSISEIANQMGITAPMAVIKLLLSERGECSIIQHTMSENDIVEILRAPFSMIGSDAGARISVGSLASSLPHPRAYGTFPRIISRYVKDKCYLSLPEAIFKMTYLPAYVFNLAGRGKLVPGCYADIVIFDYNKIQDNATYANPFLAPSGIIHVLVNGKILVANAVLQDILPGHFIH